VIVDAGADDSSGDEDLRDIMNELPDALLRRGEFR